MAYSDDDDLGELGIQNVSGMGTLDSLHDKAATEIDNRIKRFFLSQGFTDAEADTKFGNLSTQTISELTSPACYYVMHLYYQGKASVMENAAELRDYYLDRFETMFGAIRLEIDSDADGTPEETHRTGGKVYLG